MEAVLKNSADDVFISIRMGIVLSTYHRHPGEEVGISVSYLVSTVHLLVRTDCCAPRLLVQKIVVLRAWVHNSTFRFWCSLPSLFLYAIGATTVIIV